MTNFDSAEAQLQVFRALRARLDAHSEARSCRDINHRTQPLGQTFVWCQRIGMASLAFFAMATPFAAVGSAYYAYGSLVGLAVMLVAMLAFCDRGMVGATLRGIWSCRSLPDCDARGGGELRALAWTGERVHTRGTDSRERLATCRAPPA